MKIEKKPAPAKKKVSAAPEKSSHGWIHYLVLFAFAFVLYGNSISNKFALDDGYVITGNKFTKQGFEGIPALLSKHFFAGYYGDKEIFLPGGRYRPLSLVTYAIEYQVSGENPHLNHFVNVLLYALTGCVLFSFLRRLFNQNRSEKWYLSVPLVAVLLFLAHPVHTEVVANIKGRDEILSLLGSLLSGVFYLKYLAHRRWKYLVYIFLCFLMAVFSKENAFLFIVLIPLSIYFFREWKFRDNIIALTPLLVAGIIFLLVRAAVLAGLPARPSTELLDNPFVEATMAQKYGTILFTLGMYLKLLFIPHPLTWDYYPYHIALVDFTSVKVWISLVLYLLLAGAALAGIRKKTVFSYAILFFLIALSLVSNLVFPIGVFMAERFLYLPSVAFCLLAAWVLVRYLYPYLKKKNLSAATSLQGLLLVILLLFTIKTVSRNTVWKDDYTLYTTDVETSANSAKGNNIAGQWYAYAANRADNAARKNELYAKALQHLQKAVTIHPTFQDAIFHLGNVYHDYLGTNDSTLACYLRVLRLNPNENMVYQNLELLLKSEADPGAQIEIWQKVQALNPGRYEPNFHLAALYAVTDLPLAVRYMEAAAKAKPEAIDALKFLGTASINLQQYEQAVGYYNKVISLMPSDSEAVRNKAIAEKLILDN